MPKEAVAEFWKDYIKEPEFVFGEDPVPYLSKMPYNELISILMTSYLMEQMESGLHIIRLMKL